MKQSRITGIILAIVNVILIAVCVVFYFRTDRKEPEIRFETVDIVYEEGMDYAEFLCKVSACDDRDGDLTDRVVVEKLIENREDNTVSVFYAVSDRAGNVTKASRVFPAAFTEINSETGMRDSAAKQLLEAGIMAEINEEVIGSLDGAAEEDVFSQAPTKEPAPTLSPTASPAQSPSLQPTKMPEAEPENTPDAETAFRTKPTADPTVPVLALKASEITVNAGQGPAWVDVIGTLKDDKDDYATLFGNLSVSKYDRDKAGTYQVTVSTEDSDGNRSLAVPLTIVVK